MTASVRIGARSIGEQEACYLIAEVGTTCMGDLEKALRLVLAAHDAGMDAVKFQVIDPHQDTQPHATYKVVWDGVEQMVNMRDMFEMLVFPERDWATIAKECADLGIEFLATCDYIAGVEMLERIGISAHKIGAWDTTYKPLIDRIGRTGKPMIVDLGPTTQDEFDEMVRWYTLAGGSSVLPLHDYHTDLSSQKNLRAITHLKAIVNAPVGFSSPDRACDVDLLALGLGASILEKRLILSRSDRAFHAHESLEPAELKEWVRRLRDAEAALGRAALIPSDNDLAGAKKYYRSIALMKSVAKGEVLTPDTLDGKRPGTGLPTCKIDEFVGRAAVRDLPENVLLEEQDVEPLR